jgi:hypothetical protein
VSSFVRALTLRYVTLLEHSLSCGGGIALLLLLVIEIEHSPVTLAELICRMIVQTDEKYFQIVSS